MQPPRGETTQSRHWHGWHIESISVLRRDGVQDEGWISSELFGPQSRQVAHIIVGSGLIRETAVGLEHVRQSDRIGSLDDFLSDASG